MKINQFGRSMIEMLGVLAIIGVLSVGAIAGYQKAMMKYKLNKHAQSFNMLLSNALQLSPSVNKADPKGNSSQDISYNELLLKANLLPDGISYKNQKQHIYSDHLQDFLGNKMNFYSRTFAGYNFGLLTYLENTSYTSDLCQNIINVAKEHSSNIIKLTREDLSSGATRSISIFSDCSKGTCFQNLSITDIANICQVADSKTNNRGLYYFYILW